MKSRKITFLALFIAIFSSSLIFAQPPSGYYNTINTQTGDALRSALFNIIKGHTSVSYSTLWTSFKTTDKKTNGKVWDMYSDNPTGTPAYEFTFVTDQCGTYGVEGDCYNREHSFPASWFSDANPMYTDLFHLVPTDGKVNGQRSNYPFGEVGTVTWTSTNGSKLGSSSFSGYSGVVFEPIDAYKGDFARNYFYMLTRYYDVCSSWSTPMMTGNNFSTWSKNLLLQWSIQDPVSAKEIARNNAVYTIQHNRNPYIDHPEYACAVWGPCATDIYETTNNFEFSIYPNPTSNVINIEYYLSENSNVDIEIYDITGKNVATLLNENQFSGTQIFTWNSENLQTGIYFVKLNTDNQIIYQKLIINK